MAELKPVALPPKRRTQLMDALHSAAISLIHEADTALENVPLEYEEAAGYLRQALVLLDLHADLTPDGPVPPTRKRQEAQRA